MINLIEKIIDGVDSFLTVILPPLCILMLLNVFIQILTK